MTKYIIVAVFVIINGALLLLNWELFTTYFTTNFGLGDFSALPFIILQLLGFFICIAFVFFGHFKQLKHELEISKLEKEILILEKENQIKNNASNGYSGNSAPEKEIEQNIELKKERL